MINRSLWLEIGFRACLYVESQPRDLRWFRNLWGIR